MILTKNQNNTWSEQGEEGIELTKHLARIVGVDDHAKKPKLLTFQTRSPFFPFSIRVTIQSKDSLIKAVLAKQFDSNEPLACVAKQITNSDNSRILGDVQVVLDFLEIRELSRVDTTELDLFLLDPTSFL